MAGIRHFSEAATSQGDNQIQK